MRAQYHNRRELFDMILYCKIPILPQDFRVPLLGLVKMYFAEEKIVFRVIRKRSLIEHFPIEF